LWINQAKSFRSFLHSSHNVFNIRVFFPHFLHVLIWFESIDKFKWLYFIPVFNLFLSSTFSLIKNSSPLFLWMKGKILARKSYLNISPWCYTLWRIFISFKKGWHVSKAIQTDTWKLNCLIYKFIFKNFSQFI
jgi:hypothetical protein